MRGRPSLLLLSLATFLYLLLTTSLWLLAEGDARISLPFLILHQAFALGVAIELAELALALALPRLSHPFLPDGRSSPVKVAVLYLCCDDVDDDALAGLSRLHGADVFVLDDSESEACRKRVDLTVFPVVRRLRRDHFKAGNLNHWLARHGASYKYFAILDSDSLLSAEALWSLVGYAEHPVNRDVAVVQSAVAAREGNSFQEAISCSQRLRQEIVSRVHDRVGWSLSQGHNNLHRAEAVLEIGGFSTVASCEDTATSLALLRRGWRIIQVPIPSFEAEPADAFAYRRRLVRWGRQTIDLIRSLNGDLSAGQVLLLARHLLSYLLPSISMALIVLLFWVPSLSTAPPPARSFLTPAWRGLPTFSVAGLWGALLLLAVLRLSLFRRCGGTIGAFLRGTVLGGAVANFCYGPVEAGLVRSFLGHTTAFRSTGSFPSRRGDFHRLLAGMAVPMAFYLATLVLGFARGRQGIGTIQALWLAIGLASPLVLWLFHRDQDRGKPRCAA